MMKSLKISRSIVKEKDYNAYCKINMSQFFWRRYVKYAKKDKKTR